MNNKSGEKMNKKLRKTKSRKKGFALAINYVFIFFIASIVAMVVISIITKGYLSASKFTCRLTGTCDSGGSHTLPNWRVNITNCNRAESEIIKHAALCYQLGIQGETKGPCYVLLLPETCPSWPDSSDIWNKLWNNYNINSTIDYQGGNKVSIGYDYDKQKVTID